MHTRSILSISLLAAAPLFAGGGVKQVSLKIPDEMAPPGGLVQMKLLVTEPTPISSGNVIASYDDAMFDDIWGIELFNPSGDVSGVAMVTPGKIQVQYTASSGPLGSDYPIMTLAMHIRKDAPAGQQTQFNLDSASTWVLGLLGATTLKPIAPATVTVGGGISIMNVVPGGGMLQPGTVVSIVGMGFQPKTHVQLNAIKAGPVTVVNPQLIQFTVAEAVNMTGKKIQVVNPDGSQDTYFSYLRGIPLAQSARPLLQPAVPIYSAVTHTKAIFAPMGASSTTQFTGLALQNPSQSPAGVTVALYAPDGSLLGSSAIVLPSGYRIMGETSELTQGATPVAGSYAVVSSDQSIQMFGFVGDDAAASVVPFAPVQSQP
jgi:hypothetical protein